MIGSSSTEPPTTTPAVVGVPDFWERLRGAPRRFLGLDYDGTLAPFCEDRMRATPLPGVRELLARLRDASHTTVVVVSGRLADEVADLLAVPGLRIVGSHGFEMRHPDGRSDVAALSGAQARGLSVARERALAAGLGERLETKVASVALHTRGLPAVVARQQEEDVSRLWADLGDDRKDGRGAGGHGLERLRFDGGVELRATGRDKGVALAELLAEQSPETFCVYVGDDTTDEDAFRVLGGRGVGVRVGRREVATAAAGRLEDCAAVKRFLEAWAESPPGE